jgi:hypothetical protein
MKKEAKVEFGIVITKPWSSEMYAHNDEVADIVRNEVEALWIEAYELAEKELEAEEEDYVGFPELQWDQAASEDMINIQRAITCYGFGYGYDVNEVAERVMQELEDAPTYRLKEIAEDLEIELEKGFVGFN